MTTAVISPVTAQQIAEVGSASVEETDAAIARAQEAFPAWRDVAPGERARLLRAFASSKVARAALGDDVVDHYVNMADVELAAFDAAVTDWELRRGFERL